MVAKGQLGHGIFERFAPKNLETSPEVEETIVWKKLPPTIEDFVQKKEYLGQVPLSKRQAKALRAVFGDDPTRIFEDQTLPTESVFLWGKGSGKDFVCSYAVAYLAYVFLCLRDPYAYFHMGYEENIDILNVAQNAQQAKNVFFKKLKGRMSSSCFNEFRPTINANAIEFENSPLRLYSMHAASESWEGYNILAWVMDEASAFKAANGNTDNASACYGVLRTSANSRFGVNFRWIGLIISFPRKQVGDFTYDKYKETIDDPTMYGDKAAHWEVNPTFDPEHPFYANSPWEMIPDLNLNVPKAYAKEFLKDPTEAKTKYMCEPPPQEGGFFEIPSKIYEAVDKDLPPLRATKQVVTKEVRQLNRRTQMEEVIKLKYISNLIDAYPPKVPECDYFAHGDPGLINDAFAFCVCHTLPESRWLIDSEGREREVKKVVVDFLITWEPKPETPVDLSNVDELILKICHYYGIRRVTFDRWNSAGSIQRLIENGIMAEDLAFSLPQQLEIYRNLKMLFYNHLIAIPDDEALTNELVYLKVENNKITHDAFGKDRADAIAAAAWSATGEQLTEAQRLIRETLGEIYNQPIGSQYGLVNLNWGRQS